MGKLILALTPGSHFLKIAKSGISSLIELIVGDDNATGTIQLLTPPSCNEDTASCTDIGDEAVISSPSARA